MRNIPLAITLAVLCASLPAQDAQKLTPTSAPKSQAKTKELPFEERTARQYLDAAEGEFAAYEPADRAILCHQTSRGMMKYNRDGARELLHRCIAATQELTGEKEISEKQQLQGWLVQLLLTYGPEEGETLLTQIDGKGRERVRGSLIDTYVVKKNFDRAIDLVRGVQTSEEGFPYVSVANLMTRLPEEQKGDVNSLFTFALNDFHQRKAEQNTIRSEDMATLVVRFWRHVPPDVALSAVDEVLSKAKEADDVKQHSYISIGNKDGAASFNSSYEYRVFQMLPILRELDASRAESIERDMTQMKALMNRYPNGIQSLVPTLRDTPKGENENSDLSMSISDSPAGNADPDAELRVQIRKQIDDIIAQAEKSPRQAIAQALSLPMKMQRAGYPKMKALEGIALTQWKKSPTVAKEAIAELLKLAPEVDFVHDQLQFLVSATDLLLKMDDKDSAAKVIDIGMKLGRKQFEDDTKADDPNKAPKPFWPAAAIWRQFIQLSRKIDNQAALEKIKDISDPEIQLFTKITLANAWLGLGDGVVSIRTQKKNNNSWSMSGSEKIEDVSLPQ